MSKKLLAFIIILSSFVFFDNARAAFPIKTITAAKHITAPTFDNKPIISGKQHKVPHFIERVKSFMHIPDLSPKKEAGWPGIVSFVCAFGIVLGYVSILTIPASIIFGIIGLNKRYTNHGLAIAGLVLGCIELILVAVLVIILASIGIALI